MENTYLVKGGTKLSGEVKLSGAKNIALKTIIAATLFDGEVILENIPQIGDVYELMHLLRKIGVEAKFIEKNKVLIDSSNIHSNKLDFLHASKIRVSFLLFALLLQKFGTAYVPNPGGCRIGARPIDRVVDGMKALGIKLGYLSDSGYYYAQMNKQPEGLYRFSKSSHTATELLILLSIFTKDKVIIENTALEPEVDELIKFLNESGARIVRNNDKITIYGCKKLAQTQPFKIASDRNEAVTYAISALITGGDVTISSIQGYFIREFVEKIKKVGGGVESMKQDHWRFFYKGKLTATNIVTAPFPGFMTDWQPPWAVLMTQAQGESIIHESVFENRFSYVDELKKLGAKIDYIKINLKNPQKFYYFNYDVKKEYNQAIKINGLQKLHSGVLSIEDLRAGATLILAALIVSGESVINNASVLERGYENLVEKIQNLGGEISKI